MWYVYIVCHPEEFLHQAQQFTQITPLEIDILFQLVDNRHQTGSVGKHSKCLTLLHRLSLIIQFNGVTEKN